MVSTRLRAAFTLALVCALALAAWLSGPSDPLPALQSEANAGTSPPVDALTRSPAAEASRAPGQLASSSSGPGTDPAPDAPPTPKLDPRPLEEPAATRPSTAGALSPETVKRAFAAAQGGVRACARQMNRARPAPLVVDVVIEQRDGRGRLREPRIAEDAPMDAALRRCVSAALEAVNYPTEGGDAEIVVQLSFDWVTP